MVRLAFRRDLHGSSKKEKMSFIACQGIQNDKSGSERSSRVWACHGEVELGGHGEIAAVGTTCVGDFGRERWHKRVEENHKALMRLGA